MFLSFYDAFKIDSSSFVLHQNSEFAKKKNFCDVVSHFVSSTGRTRESIYQQYNCCYNVSKQITNQF